MEGRREAERSRFPRLLVVLAGCELQVGEVNALLGAWHGTAAVTRIFLSLGRTAG
jgi:hypothetical protein